MELALAEEDPAAAAVVAAAAADDDEDDDDDDDKAAVELPEPCFNKEDPCFELPLPIPDFAIPELPDPELPFNKDALNDDEDEEEDPDAREDSLDPELECFKVDSAALLNAVKPCFPAVAPPDEECLVASVDLPLRLAASTARPMGRGPPLLPPLSLPTEEGCKH